MRIACLAALIWLATTAQAAPPSDYVTLIFSDEFDKSDVNTKLWTVRAQHSDREACYAANAVRVGPQQNQRAGGDGKTLQLKVYTGAGNPNQCGKQHHIGWVDTAGKFERTYGYIEARCWFNCRRGQWGAFWLDSRCQKDKSNPNETNLENTNPKERVYLGEIDVVEALTWHGDTRDFGDRWVINLHRRGINGGVQSSGTQIRLQGKRVEEEWHTYGVEWRPDGYSFYLDNELMWKTYGSLSDQPHYLVLSTQVDDGNFAGRVPPGGYDSFSDARVRVEVDWIRWWKKANYIEPPVTPHPRCQQ